MTSRKAASGMSSFYASVMGNTGELCFPAMISIMSWSCSHNIKESVSRRCASRLLCAVPERRNVGLQWEAFLRSSHSPDSAWDPGQALNLAELSSCSLQVWEWSPPLCISVIGCRHNAWGTDVITHCKMLPERAAPQPSPP